MKLTIKVIHPLSKTAKQRRTQEIQVDFIEETSSLDADKLLYFERWLNEHSKSRFHLTLDETETIQ